MMDVELYTDGACRGNPGRGGYGSILVYRNPSNGEVTEREYSAGYRLTTNNRMELMAALVGLRNLTKPCNVTLYSDSKYLCDAFNQHWIEGWVKNNFKGKANPELWKAMLEVMKPHNIKFIWVKGHAGHSYNERCDKLATNAADNCKLIIDGDYEQDRQK